MNQLDDDDDMGEFEPSETVVYNHLARKALTYWNVSLAYHKRAKAAEITVGDALVELRQLIEFLGPHRPLRNRAMTVSHWIITGERKEQIQHVGA